MNRPMRRRHACQGMDGSSNPIPADPSGLTQSITAIEAGFQEMRASYGSRVHQTGSMYDFHDQTLAAVRSAQKAMKMAMGAKAGSYRKQQEEAGAQKKKKGSRRPSKEAPCLAETPVGRLDGRFIRLPSPAVPVTGDLIGQVPIAALNDNMAVECKQFAGNPPGRRLSSYTINAVKEYKEQSNPLDPETEFLSTLTGFSKRRVEEMRRRWYKSAGSEGLCDVDAFKKLMEKCNVSDIELLSLLFNMLDLEMRNKMSFEQCMRACGVFRLGGQGLTEKFGYLTQKLISDEQDGRTVSIKITLREGPLTKERDLYKAKVRMALLKHFYSDVSKEEKRLANLQVDLMMEMLQEDLDPPDPLNGTNENEGDGEGPGE